MPRWFIPSLRYPGELITVDIPSPPDENTGRELEQIRDIVDNERAWDELQQLRAEKQQG